MQGGKPAVKTSKSSAVKVQRRPEDGNTLITILKVLLPIIVVLAIFLPRLLQSEKTV